MNESDGTTAPRTRACAACRTILYAEDRFCPCCGAAVLERCRSCGAELAHTHPNYCSHCGAARPSADDRITTKRPPV